MRGGSSFTLLDGATGTELRARGIEVPSHVTSLWSAKALWDAPDAVVEVHRDYIAAGADVITVNNYAVTPPLLAREDLAHRFEELTDIAADLALRARDDAGRDGVRIAGSLPPLETSYRADLVGDDDTILSDYRRMAQVLAGKVDILLCETMASAREAVAAVTAARETDREVWLSWTLQGNRIGHLPSGETIGQAFRALANDEPDAYLVNCCGANFVTEALVTLSALTERPIGGYANCADVIPGEGSEIVEFEKVERSFLDAEAYAASGAEWLDRGASIIGGCCGTRPAYIDRLNALRS